MRAWTRCVVPVVFFSVCVNGLLFPPRLFAEVPRALNYQGLVTAAGGSLLEGTHQFHFAIYSDTAGASRLWEETQSLEVYRGQLNALLGRVSPLTDVLFDGGPRFIGVRIDEDPEARPLRALTSVMFSLRAGQADDVSGKDINPRSVAIPGWLGRPDHVVISESGQWLGDPSGLVGLQGPIGPMGPAGPQGATGPQGAAGPAGATGATGPTGLTGATGATGPAGPQDLSNYSGPYPVNFPFGSSFNVNADLRVNDVTQGDLKGTHSFKVLKQSGLAADFITTTSATQQAVGINAGSNSNLGLFVVGKITATGTKAATKQSPTGEDEFVYCVEGPEVQIMATGHSTMNGGVAVVEYPPGFISWTSDVVPIQVLVTPSGPCNGIFVESRTHAGFAVRELGGGTSNASFDWLVVGRRTGY